VSPDFIQHRQGLVGLESVPIWETYNEGYAVNNASFPLGPNTANAQSSVTTLGENSPEYIAQRIGHADNRPGLHGKLRRGVTEVQTITTASDGAFVPTIQTITSSSGSGSDILSGSFSLSFRGSDIINVPFDVSDIALETAINALPGIQEAVVSSREVNYNGLGVAIGYVWTVTIYSPAGNLDLIVASDSVLDPLRCRFQSARIGSLEDLA
jgi:hypothetical protein